MTETLTLKWGTLKAWDLKTDASKAALKQYFDAGDVQMSAAMQRDNADQKQALCGLIDALDADAIYLDWDGKDVSKDEAKNYIRNYGSAK